MDIATICGIIAGISLISLSVMTGGNAKAFINIPSVLATMGGTMAATFISFPLKTVFNVFNVIKKTVLHHDRSRLVLITSIVEYARKARKEGMLSLEEEAEAESDDFMRKGLMLAVDGTESELMLRIMNNEISAVENRHEVGQNVMKTMGAFAPAFGMIGTLIGLVQMLSQLNDPSKIGPGMAVALLTTFYGALAANLFFLPMAEKLKDRSKEEVERMELIIEGIMSIKAGDTPRVVKEKLKSFLKPDMRDKLDKED
jgi:chemotaxis protein MotA